jgi:NAD(P)-dependent dehydrogenase (short-subunit alcohol dehydrogenase family)
MDLGLRGKKAIVTGGTRGIGRAICELLAAEGVDVGLCARNEDEVQSTVAALKQRGVNAVGGVVNVRDGEALKTWLESAATELGGCDIFIPNASAGGGADSEKNCVRNFEIDLMHTVRGCEALLPHLKKGGQGAIVMIASTNALETFGMPQGYNALKGSLVIYAKQLSQVVAKDGVRVNSVSPGPVQFEGGAWEFIHHAIPKLYATALAQIPTTRMGTPDEVARIVVFLASPASSMIVGANVVCDLGFTKRVQF